MTSELIIIGEENLFNYLFDQDSPVMELDIIKYFIPSNDSVIHQSTLFVKHFSVYHALYKLKTSAGLKGYYLHLDCMRIRMIHIPAQGLCRHYYPETGNFCNKPTESSFCGQHQEEYKDYRHSMIFDLLQDFYIDPENLAFEDSGLLKKIMNGISTYCIKKRDIDEALGLFEISRPGKNAIARRYRELAGKYHPDRYNDSGEMMKRINSAYMILKEVYIL